MSVDKYIGHEVIVDILAVCSHWAKSSVMSSLATEQVVLIANPHVPNFLEARVDDEAT